MIRIWGFREKMTYWIRDWENACWPIPRRDAGRTIMFVALFHFWTGLRICFIFECRGKITLSWGVIESILPSSRESNGTKIVLFCCWAFCGRKVACARFEKWRIPYWPLWLEFSECVGFPRLWSLLISISVESCFFGHHKEVIVFLEGTKSDEICFPNKRPLQFSMDVVDTWYQNKCSLGRIEPKKFGSNLKK